MIEVTQFSIKALETYKTFFLLDKLDKNQEEVEILVQTPTGLEAVDFVEVFSMKDGSLLAGWQHPFQKMALHNLIASANGKSQILNLYPVERIIDIYDSPLDIDSTDNNLWSFSFASSAPVDGGDWRCDRGMYGPRMFPEEDVNRVISDLGEIIVYEPFLCINSIGHLVYISGKNKRDLAIEKLNNSFHPTTALTLQETLRLIYEWSQLAGEPFNSQDDVAVLSEQFINSLNLTDEELLTLSQLPNMQIANFLTGSEAARTRPDNPPVLSQSIKDLIFNRMATTSLSFITARNPGIWDFEEIYNKEIESLNQGEARFRSYYGVPNNEPLDTESKAGEYARANTTNQEGYIHNQLRGFKNKKIVMNMALEINQQNG